MPAARLRLQTKFTVSERGAPVALPQPWPSATCITRPGPPSRGPRRVHVVIVWVTAGFHTAREYAVPLPEVGT